MPDLSHIHRYVDGDRAAPILALHGTGGDENDLLSLAAAIAPGAAILSPRGQVKEGGANRFFRRFAEGVFDVEDLKARTDALAAFIAEGRAAYGLAKPIALGFSNGANIAASLLMRHPDALAGAVLLRAMTPFDEPASGLSGVPALILSGDHDPIVTTDDASRLAGLLRSAGAVVDYRLLRAGHGLTQEDLVAAQSFVSTVRSKIVQTDPLPR